MLFEETVPVYCENHKEHIDTVCTSQKTHYVSTTEPNRLMLFGETVAVYCENHTEHIDTVCTSQETHYVSATEPNRLMLFEETVAVYCENQTELITTLCEQHAASLMLIHVGLKGLTASVFSGKYNIIREMAEIGQIIKDQVDEFG
jgi:translation initiation factor IF-1